MSQGSELPPPFGDAPSSRDRDNGRKPPSFSPIRIGEADKGPTGPGRPVNTGESGMLLGPEHPIFDVKGGQPSRPDPMNPSLLPL